MNSKENGGVGGREEKDEKNTKIRISKDEHLLSFDFFFFFKEGPTILTCS